MNRLHDPRMRRRLVATLTGVLTLLVLGTIAPFTAQAAISCTPANTMTGQNGAAINVAGGQTKCLVGLTQTGAVTVDPDGTLAVRSSKITGAVFLNSGFSEFEFCGSSTVGGAISANGGKGPVTIGNTGLLGTGLLACDPNTVGGAVVLNGNLSSVTLARNEIKEAVTASGNTGGTKIAGNHIVGALKCTTNAPPPNNFGLLNTVPMRNTVGGARTGQTCLSGSF